MRSLFALLLAGFVAPVVLATDKDEDKAKATAVAFVKAAKAKDIDAVMKTVDVPFYWALDNTPRIGGPAGKRPVTSNPPDNKPRVIEKVEELKAELKLRIETVKDIEKLSDEVNTVVDLLVIRKNIEAKKPGADTKTLDKVFGEQGHVIAFGKAEEPHFVVWVRIHDGKATVGSFQVLSPRGGK